MSKSRDNCDRVKHVDPCVRSHGYARYKRERKKKKRYKERKRERKKWQAIRWRIVSKFLKRSPSPSPVFPSFFFLSSMYMYMYRQMYILTKYARLVNKVEKKRNEREGGKIMRVSCCRD